MKTMWLVGILLLAFSLHKPSMGGVRNKVVCYYGSWAVYRPGYGKFDVEDIDPNLCTHINYAFVGINNDGSVRIMDSWNEIDKEALKRFRNLKEKNPQLKALIAIGGWNEGSIVFSSVANSLQLRTNFIRSAVNLIKTYGYDGFDLDWEYPAQRGGASYDVENFVQLLKEFRAEFSIHDFLLTAAVASAESSVDQSYDVLEIAKYLDFINVMTYDLHGSWDGVTGHNSPLYPSSIDVTEFEQSLNIEACVKEWICRGAPPEKLVLGMGTYGRTFTLANTNNNGLGAIAYSGGAPGPYTRESGFLGYNEICENIKAGGWNEVWDDEQRVPHAHKDNQWVGYDNERSIALKVQYAIDLGLGGVMIWSLETDDFRGACGRANPLLQTINENLNNKPSPIVTNCTIRIPSTDPEIEVTEPGNGSEPGSEICTREGYIRDPDDCSIFYYCLAHAGSYIQYKYQCQSGLLYDTNLGVCNWPSAVTC